MSKHTQGKWSNDDKIRPYCVVDTQGLLIANCYLRTTGSDEEAKANTRLIAAAPELLEACKQVLTVEQNRVYKNYAVVYTLEQAIAKAEGGK